MSQTIKPVPYRDVAAIVVAFLILGALLGALAVLPSCTATQRKAAAALADDACVLLLDTGAPDAVERVCEAEQAVYPVVRDALATAQPATAQCPVTPEAAPVLALRAGAPAVEVPRVVLTRVRALRVQP